MSTRTQWTRVRMSGGGPSDRVRVPVMARLGSFAITPGLKMWTGQRHVQRWTVTHVPTGLGAVVNVPLAQARRAMRALHATKGCDWRFKGVKDMSPKTHALGVEIARKYGRQA